METSVALILAKTLAAGNPDNTDLFSREFGASIWMQLDVGRTLTAKQIACLARCAKKNSNSIRLSVEMELAGEVGPGLTAPSTAALHAALAYLPAYSTSQADKKAERRIR